MGRNFHQNAVTGPQPYKVGDSRTCEVRDDFLLGFQFEAKRRARQRFYDCSRYAPPVAIPLIPFS